MPALLLLILLLLLSRDGEVASSSDGGQFSYQGFAGANLTLDGLAVVMPSGLLALTNFTQQTKAHAFHPAPLRFLNNNNTAVSFSTSFVFAIVSGYDGLSDHGFAFVVAPTTNFTTAGAGQYLGLLNTTNGTPSAPILAVELDTIVNPEFQDINSNHVGIDVNSLVSRQARPAGYYDDDRGGALQGLTLNSRKPMQVWVDYDGQAKQLEVTLAPVHVPKPRKPLLSEAIDLSTLMADAMYVGFSASSGVVSAHHYLLGWSFSLGGSAPPLDFSKLPALPRLGPKPRSKVLDIVLPLASALLVATALAAVFFFLWRRRRFAEVREGWEDEFGPHRYAYKDLHRATHGFTERNLLGVGGFGRVYKGRLSASNLEIAVKRVSHESRQGLREFVAEVASIGRLRHRNLVQLLGYCRRKDELLLVYDYMSNGSLDKHLHDPNMPTVTWPETAACGRRPAAATATYAFSPPQQPLPSSIPGTTYLYLTPRPLLSQGQGAMAVVGVLALQGSYNEHMSALRRIGVKGVEVRKPEQLQGIDSLIIPGGESTTMAKLANYHNLFPALREFVGAGKPVWGTCAGLIFLANKAVGQKSGGQELVGGLDCTVHRNFFGSQLQSFETELSVPMLAEKEGGSNTCRGVFIRAPAILEVGSDVEILADCPVPSGKPSITIPSSVGVEEEVYSKDRVIVAVRQGNILATAFHPELTSDCRWHRFFLDMDKESHPKAFCALSLSSSSRDSEGRSMTKPFDLPIFE